jgi:P4 family phage/plasmid primase-like protien
MSPPDQNLPLRFEEITNPLIRVDGSISRYKFLKAEASRILCNRLTLVMAEGSDDIWRFNGRVFQSDGNEHIKYLLYSTAGNEVDTRIANEVVDRIKSELQQSPQVLNPKPYLLGVENGVLDCKTAKYRPYAKEDLITDQLPVRYDPAAKCPEIIRFIESITPNYDDRITLIDIFASGAYRKALAYIAFLIGHGSSGSTTYIELLQAFYGEKNTEAIPLNELVEKQFALSSLKNARFSIGQEIDEVRKAGTARIKEISGGDWISADQKNKDRVRFRGWTKLIFKGNEVPRFTDATWGFRRRFVEVKLPYKFVPIIDPDEPNQRMMIPDIIDRLTTPAELSGLLNLIAVRLPWIIENKRIYRGEGQYEAYRLQVDSVTAFLDAFSSYYPESKSVRESVKTIHEYYQKWCTLTLANEVDVRQFGKYVRRYCENKPGLETTIGGKTATVYPGLTFDKDKYDEEIANLHSQLVTGLNRNTNGSNTGLKSILQIPITGYTGLNSIDNTIDIDISSKDLWDEIVSLFGSSTWEEQEKAKIDPVIPVSDKQRPGDNPASNPAKPDCIPVFSVVEEECRAQRVQEYLATGGQAGLQRLKAAFPEVLQDG